MRTNSPPSLHEFQKKFSSERACEAFLFRWRWPDGFRCPRCSGASATRLARRKEQQCRQCRYQVSVTSGTALHRTKLPLRTWFWAIFLVARHKKSISALQLKADLCVNYRTAWLLLHKVRAILSERSDFPLRGLVEVDESIVAGSPGEGGGGRGSDRPLVVAAVERLPNGKLGSARAEVVTRADAATLIPFVRRHVAPEAHVATDGWRGYITLPQRGFSHTREVSRYGLPRLRPVLSGVHGYFSNLKTWLRGRFHGVSPKYLPAYLAEFTYRFNRRQTPADNFAWILRRLMRERHRGLAEIMAADATA
jgi:transposase-like protein